MESQINEKTIVLKSTSILYRQSRKTIVILLWLLLLVAITAYIFQIWNAVASINMLQTASPNDVFKENTNTYQQYKNLAIGSVVMSTLELLLFFILLGAFYTYFNSMKYMFLILKKDRQGAAGGENVFDFGTPETASSSSIPKKKSQGITVFS